MNNTGHLVWVVFGALVGFGASFIFADLLALPLDLYYLIYFATVIAFFTVYVKKTALESESMVFQTSSLGNSAWTGFWSFAGTERPVEAGDGTIHRSLPGLADSLERVGLWGD